MNRREFLQCAAIMITGASATQLGFALSDEQKTYLATAPDYIAGELDYLTPVQRNIIAAMAEVVIPRTETPGAIDAGVPRFIELMAGDWFNDQERGIFTAGLREMETGIPEKYGKLFFELEASQQLQIMQDLEQQAEDSSWYDFANVQRQFISDAPFICQVKELTIWGFFTSEVGAKEVLRYEPMPMRFDGDIPLGSEESTWAGSSF
ncbi:MAG: gluconate 2-dehydrogenase subunit 3 family protein [Halioglobus sp.]